MARVMPVIPLIGAETKFQPVFVGNVAEAIARGLDGALPPGSTWELGGPDIYSLREIVAYVCALAKPQAVFIAGAVRASALYGLGTRGRDDPVDGHFAENAPRNA
jgi:uncharacterized protein YbjT (DUF2867 family)